MTKMRIGQGGSFNNRLAEACQMPAPEVGMGATIMSYTDRHAATIVEVSACGTRIAVIEDIAKRTDGGGMSESQSYEYSPGNGEKQYFSRRSNGMWIRVGSEARNGTAIAIGYRDSYHDYSF